MQSRHMMAHKDERNIALRQKWLYTNINCIYEGTKGL